MEKSSAVTVRLDDGLRAELEALARETRRSRSFLAAQAIADYVALQRWQITAIKEGIAAAERGDFIPHEDVMVELEARLARKKAEAKRKGAKRASRK